jgi:hypothetical protein
LLSSVGAGRDAERPLERFAERELGRVSGADGDLSECGVGLVQQRGGMREGGDLRSSSRRDRG